MGAINDNWVNPNEEKKIRIPKTRNFKRGAIKSFELFSGTIKFPDKGG